MEILRDPRIAHPNIVSSPREAFEEMGSVFLVMVRSRLRLRLSHLDFPGPSGYHCSCKQRHLSSPVPRKPACRHLLLVVARHGSPAESPPPRHRSTLRSATSTPSLLASQSGSFLRRWSAKRFAPPLLLPAPAAPCEMAAPGALPTGAPPPRPVFARDSRFCSIS